MPHFSLVTIAPLLATTRVLVRALASVVIGATNKHENEVVVKQQAQVVPSGLRLGVDVLALCFSEPEGGEISLGKLMCSRSRSALARPISNARNINLAPDKVAILELVRPNLDVVSVPYESL